MSLAHTLHCLVPGEQSASTIARRIRKALTQRLVRSTCRLVRGSIGPGRMRDVHGLETDDGDFFADADGIAPPVAELLKRREPFWILLHGLDTEDDAVARTARWPWCVQAA
jgi:hypothetical protein